MRRTLRSLLGLALLPLVVSCVETGPGPDDDDAADDDATDPCEGIAVTVTDLTPDDLAEMLEDKDLELINVHIPYAGQIPDTDEHIPYTDTDGLEAYLDHDPGVRAVLYCRTGPMSETATNALAARGYCQIFDLPGGMVGWDQAGYVVEP